MSIHRSGLVKPVRVQCVQALKVSDVTFIIGEKYELVLDMGIMYVLKTPSGQEAVVPKDAFTPVEEKGYK